MANPSSASKKTTSKPEEAEKPSEPSKPESAANAEMDVLDEDDEFEEFESHELAPEDLKQEEQLWEDDWDDDTAGESNLGDDFTAKLRAELMAMK
ncbi:26 proteasome complex subunit DSS1 [Pseudoscourfieldia marina]